jgi:hypothetical protein
MKKFLLGSALIAGILLAFLYVEEVPKTPLENNQYQSLPKSDEISDFIHDLAGKSEWAQVVTLGQSAGGRDIEAVLISSGLGNKLSVMLIGSQHATEASGAEALQMLVRDILTDSKNNWLDDMNFIIIVNANPDGRDNNTRLNATKGNINIDYIELGEDETILFVKALKKYQPNVILDLHESYVRKRILTSKQGYMNDYDSQFAVNNNPNLPTSLNEFSQNVFLPALIKANSDMGVPAQQYRGEILQLKQPIAYAGMRLWNLRNYSAMNGAISVLVENRLDPRNETYPTPQNIKVRTEKQKISIEAFLNTAQTYKDHILALRTATKNQTLMLRHQFIIDSQNPTVDIPLINVRTGEQEMHPFPNFAKVSTSMPLTLPKAYVITDEQERFMTLLSKHHLTYHIIQAPQIVTVTQSTIRDIHKKYNLMGSSTILEIDTDEHSADILLKPGDLWIDVNQPMGELIPLMLEPRSTDSIFQEKPYQSLLKIDETLLIGRVL